MPVVKYFLLVFITSLIFSSCGIYRPNAVNVPMLRNKGELQVTGKESFSGLEGQAAYALSRKVAILANYNNAGSHTEKFSDNNYTISTHYFGEVGIGLFQCAVHDSTHKIREAFLFGGNGMTSHLVRSADTFGKAYTTFQRVYYNRLGVQCDLGREKRHFSYAFSPRLFLIHYFDFTDDTRDDYKYLSNLQVYLEPAFTIRYVVGHYITLSAQTSVTIPVINYKGGYNYYYDFGPINLSVGAGLRLNCLSRLK